MKAQVVLLFLILGQSLAASGMPQIPGEGQFMNTSASSVVLPSVQAFEPFQKAQVQEIENAAVNSLEKFVFPDENSLRQEMRVADVPTYNKSVEILQAWAKGKLGTGPGSARVALIDAPCRLSIDDADSKLTHFPMSEFNLRCIPWWLEKRSLGKPAKSEVQAPGDSVVKSDASESASQSSPIQGATGRLSSLSDWQNLKESTYRQFLRRFRPASTQELFKHIGFALDESVGCESSIALAGLVSRTEEFLPDADVWLKLQKVYQKYAVCQSTDAVAESVHQRMGLTAIFFGELDIASKALSAALELPIQEEKQRTLFWSGLLLRTDAHDREVVSNFQNKYWTQLWHESPLSIHAVIASHVAGQDPYATLVGNVYQPIRRRDGFQWSDYNLVALLSELFIVKEDALALKNWSARVARDWTETENEKRLYLAVVHNKAHNYLQSIQILSTYLKFSERQTYQVQFLKLLFPTPFSESILKASNDLDPLLVYALIRQESAFNPYARSVADARGLMQLLPTTAKTLEKITPYELYEPSRNVALGSRYLQKLLTLNNNHLEKVLAAYNAGQRNLLRWNKRFPGANDLLFADLIPFKETRSYVSLIQRNAYWYGRLWVDQENWYGPELRERLVQSNDKVVARSKTVDKLLKISWNLEESQIDLQTLLPDLNNLRHFANQ